ncbi:MAG: hypothetical protein WC343_07455 [Bacilli bacterium]|jgi:hypothetical protein
MTLTEEQRAALKRVIAYMDEMYSVASPYHGCTEDANILRAMIDSSGTVEPTGGFDLEKARAADEALPYPLDANEIWVSGKGQMHINPPNAPSIFFTLSDLCEFRNLFHGQAAEIERLRADLEQSEICIRARLDVIDQQAARIAELEKWLKKERSARLLEKSGSILLAYLKENEIDFDKFFDGKALEQLQAEGKIGSSDHSSDVTKKVWQITEERKAALSAMSSLRTDVDCPQCDAWLHFSDIAEHAPVLRAMLTEAGQ